MKKTMGKKPTPVGKPAPKPVMAPQPASRKPVVASAPRPAVAAPKPAPAAPTPAQKAVAQIAESTKKPPQTFEHQKEPTFKKVVSTGSTLLDLAIAGTRIYGGGIPGGILVEIYGQSGAGKTAILAEVCASAQAKGGNVFFNDPEGRLDTEYSLIYGVSIDENNYSQPDTVMEAFDEINAFLKKNFREKDEDPINVCATDSIAALTTDLEMSEDRDKMGMKKAKDLSQETRRAARIIAQSGNIVMCSNQIREGQNGETVTPGGKAIPFFASLRMSIKRIGYLDRTMKVALGGDTEEEAEEVQSARAKLAKGMREKPAKGSAKEVKKILGIKSEVEITKSSVDSPHRKAIIVIRFGYGLDDVAANLMYLKDMRNQTSYILPNGKSFVGLEQAIAAVEADNQEKALKKEVIETWTKVENAFQSPRKPKQR